MGAPSGGLLLLMFGLDWDIHGPASESELLAAVDFANELGDAVADVFSRGLPAGVLDLDK